VQTQAVGSLPAEPGPSLGTHTFQAYEPPEVLNAEQVAQLLQLEVGLVLELAEASKLPGRKLGEHWRFSRSALVAWLSTPAR
jgi:excisionase family DNA binding protein